MADPIYPCLWFDGKASQAAQFYCSIFKNSRLISENPMVSIFELNGTRFMALNGGPQYTFSPANSYVITCENQEEIDYYWEKLGEGGSYSRCVWLDDKFGVSWQIVLSILEILMNDPERSSNVLKAILEMTKFEIDKLRQA